jgi:hypothetical protein
MPNEQLKNMSKYLKEGESVEKAADERQWIERSNQMTITIVRNGIRVLHIPPITTDLEGQVHLMDLAGILAGMDYSQVGTVNK